MKSRLRSVLQALAAIALWVAWGCPAEAELREDVVYGEAEGTRLLLDVRIPDGAGPFPVALVIHGGGWGSGSKDGDSAPVLEPLRASGLVTLVINYRLAPAHRWPACFDDVRAAIRWAKAHAAEYRGDPHRIALVGYSAGGQLACLAATDADESTRVQAVVALAAPTDLPADTARRGGLSVALQALLDSPEQPDAPTRARLEAMSPALRLKPGLPPFLLIHGSSDKSVAPDQSVALEAKLKELGVPCERLELSGAPHRLADWEKHDPSWIVRLTTWLATSFGSGKSVSSPDAK